MTNPRLNFPAFAGEKILLSQTYDCCKREICIQFLKHLICFSCSRCILNTLFLGSLDLCLLMSPHARVLDYWSFFYQHPTLFGHFLHFCGLVGFEIMWHFRKIYQQLSMLVLTSGVYPNPILEDLLRKAWVLIAFFFFSNTCPCSSKVSQGFLPWPSGCWLDLTVSVNASTQPSPLTEMISWLSFRGRVA